MRYFMAHLTMETLRSGKPSHSHLDSSQSLRDARITKHSTATNISLLLEIIHSRPLTLNMPITTTAWFSGQGATV